MKQPSKKSKPATSERVVAAKIKRRPEIDDAEILDAEEVSEHDDDEADEDGEHGDASESESSSAYKRKETGGSPQGFIDSLGDALRSAGETATRYTRIGVSHAEIEKLRFDLKSAHAALGEVVMRCWQDAPDLGLTSRDPAIQKAVKQVREVRRKIREKEAKIAHLKKE